MTATLRAPEPPVAPRRSAAILRSRRPALLIGAAIALAALSLLLPWALAFDPLAWVVWGRDAGRLALDTSSGPSWKPLPVLFTTPFVLLGGSAAPALWLIVARTGGLLALAGAWTLATRLGGRWAGAAAAAAMALSPWWLYNTALGNSEGLLAAAVIWAVIAHLDGRRRTALALGVAAALLRPEAWPFLIAYGAWLWRREPHERRAILAAALVVPLLWFGPDLIGAGGALDASKTARGVASAGSAKLSTRPVFALLGDTAQLFTFPALATAVVAVWLGGRTERALAAGAGAWVAIVAAMTLAGYAGNPRYLVAAAAAGAVLAGVGAVRIAGPLGAGVLVAIVLAFTAGGLRAQTREIASRATGARAFSAALAAAGGRDALVRCAPIRAGNRARSFIAWRLDLPMLDLDAPPERPAVVIRSRWYDGAAVEPPLNPSGYRVLMRSDRWQFLAACGPRTHR